MEQEKEYFAFISYKREDENWAKWLRNRLEHYKIPKSFLKYNKKFPRSLRPIFTDVNDLVAGNLSEMLYDSLINSKYLIVICSPRAAQSAWVNKEVETFIEQGRHEKIIPFIVEGMPFSKNPNEECFPPALRNLPYEQEPLGVSVQELGRDGALIRVIARMLELNYDLLWSKYNKERLLSPIRFLSIPFSFFAKLFNKSVETAIEEYLPQKDNTDIFISYRRIDGRDVARTIEQALKFANYKNVFFDYTSIQDGNFNLKILDAIYSCKDFILVLSPMAMKRCSKKGDWVAREIRTALKYKSHIIPVVIEDSKGSTVWSWPRNLPKDLEELKNIEQLPFQMGTYFPDAMRNLINRLNSSKKSAEISTIENLEIPDLVFLKVKCPVQCKIYVDDELHIDTLAKDKLKKIPLKKGEYLIRIDTIDNKVIYKERKLILREDKLLSNDDFALIEKREI